jgi:hypothetical protein
VNPQPLDLILDALARSTSMVPDPDDRDAVRRTALVCRGLTTPPQVVLVGRGTDPALETIEWVERLTVELRDTLGTVEDHVDDLLRVMRQRRNSPLAETVRTLLDLVDATAVEHPLCLTPPDVRALRLSLAIHDGVPAREGSAR